MSDEMMRQTVSITETVYADDLFSDTAGADVMASAERYADLLDAALAVAFPGAAIDVRVRPGSAGAGSFGDRVISGVSDDEAEEIADRRDAVGGAIWEGRPVDGVDDADWIVQLPEQR